MYGGGNLFLCSNTSKESDRVKKSIAEKSRVESERGAGPLIHMWSEERFALNHKLIPKNLVKSNKFNFFS